MHVEVGTLSKAFGVVGGLVVALADVDDPASGEIGQHLVKVGIKIADAEFLAQLV